MECLDCDATVPEVSDLSLKKLYTKVQLVDISGFINLILDSYVQLNYPRKGERRKRNHPQKSKCEYRFKKVDPSVLCLSVFDCCLQFRNLTDPTFIR